MEKEKTLVLLKPESIKRCLIGKILERIEDAGLKIVAMKMLWVDKEFAGKHYRQDIADKYGDKVRDTLLGHITEGPIVAMVLEGVDAIAVTRKLVGSTYPNESPPGTIRGDFGHVSKLYANTKEAPVRNLIHASGNKEDAKIEVSLWFSDEEIHSYKNIHDSIILGE